MSSSTHNCSFESGKTIGDVSTCDFGVKAQSYPDLHQRHLLDTYPFGHLAAGVLPSSDDIPISSVYFSPAISLLHSPGPPSQPNPQHRRSPRLYLPSPSRVLASQVGHSLTPRILTNANTANVYSSPPHQQQHNCIYANRAW